MCGFTKLEKIRNKCIMEEVGLASIDEKIDKKIREIRLKWIGHVQRRYINMPIRYGYYDVIESSQTRRDRGRSKKTWCETCRKI